MRGEASSVPGRGPELASGERQCDAAPGPRYRSGCAGRRSAREARGDAVPLEANVLVEALRELVVLRSNGDLQFDGSEVRHHRLRYVTRCCLDSIPKHR